jgi:hypothetical protein
MLRCFVVVVVVVVVVDNDRYLTSERKSMLKKDRRVHLINVDQMNL